MSRSQNVFTRNDKILKGEYEYFITTNPGITFDSIRSSKRIIFKNIPDDQKLTKPNSVQWLRFSIDNQTENNLIFDAQFIYTITVYIPVDSKNTKYRIVSSSPDIPIYLRDITYIHHAILLPSAKGKKIYYARIEANTKTGLGFYLHDLKSFYKQAFLSLLFPISFFSILSIIIILNTILLIRLKEIIYFYYVIYLVSIVWYELSTSGYLNALFSIAYIGDLNYIVPFSMATIAILLYIKAYLFTATKDKFSNRLLLVEIYIKLILLLIQIFTGYFPENSADLDLFLMLFPCIAIIRSINMGFKPARILLGTYCILLFGYFGHSYRYLLLDYISTEQIDLISYLGQFFLFSNLLETLLFSYALSERFVLMKTENELEHRKTISSQKLLLEQAEIHQEFKDNLNIQLEQQVSERTSELAQANASLKEQTEIIRQINDGLKIDNEKLSHDLEILHKARLLDKNLSFEEFTDTFSDETKSLQFVAQLKWNDKYHCRKCRYNKYYLLEDKISRKCKNCAYCESATVGTVLDNVKFSSLKALYLLYIIYTVKNPNIKKIAEEIDLRTATAYTFINKIAAVVKKESTDKLHQGNWTELIMKHR